LGSTSFSTARPTTRSMNPVTVRASSTADRKSAPYVAQRGGAGSPNTPSPLPRWTYPHDRAQRAWRFALRRGRRLSTVPTCGSWGGSGTRAGSSSCGRCWPSPPLRSCSRCPLPWTRAARPSSTQQPPMAPAWADCSTTAGRGGRDGRHHQVGVHRRAAGAGRAARRLQP
jgi:hypothetical protein